MKNEEKRLWRRQDATNTKILDLEEEKEEEEEDDREEE